LRFYRLLHAKEAGPAAGWSGSKQQRALAPAAATAGSSIAGDGDFMAGELPR